MFVGCPEWKFVKNNAPVGLTREGFIRLKEERFIQKILRTKGSRDEIRREDYSDR